MKPLLQALLLGTALGSATLVVAEDRAVIVGIDKYQYLKDQDLNAAVGDALKFRDFVRDDMGLRDDQITLLLDGNATRKQVIDALVQDLKYKTKPGDRMIFYYSGHGAQTSDRDGDEDDNKDEYIVLADRGKPEAFGVLLDDELRFLFEYFPDRQILVVVDACYSGTISRTAAEENDEKVRTLATDTDFLPIFEGGLPDLPPRPAERSRSQTLIPGQAHMDVWSAASQTELAFENKYGGVFTRLFLEGVKGRADRNNNGRISNAELLSYVRAGSAQFCGSSRGCKSRNQGRLTPEFGGMIEKEAVLRQAAQPVVSAPPPAPSPVVTAPPDQSVSNQPVQATAPQPAPDAESNSPSTTAPTAATSSAEATTSQAVSPSGTATPQVAEGTSAPEPNDAATQTAEGASDAPVVTAPPDTAAPTPAAPIATAPDNAAPVVTAEPGTGSPTQEPPTAEPATPTAEVNQPVPQPPANNTEDQAEDAPPQVVTSAPEPQTPVTPTGSAPTIEDGGAAPVSQASATLLDLPAQDAGDLTSIDTAPPALNCTMLSQPSGTALLEDLFLPTGNQALTLALTPGQRLRLGERVLFEVTPNSQGQVILFDLNPDCELFQIFPSVLSPANAGRAEALERITIPSALSSNGQPIEISVTEPAGRGHLVAVLIEDDLDAVTSKLPNNVNLEPVPGGLSHLTDLARALNASFVDASGRRSTLWHASILPYSIVP
ncbi:MAG: caspase family protein [Roseobacter sp.]|jgi:hypothetical protein|nr:caspase family protein [Roseobacter sp.]